MVRMFVRHKVAHFTSWKQNYDEFDSVRKEMGVVDHGVYQDYDERNELTIWHDFESIAEAHRFAQSERLKKAMEEAGVTEEPEIWFTVEP